MRSSGPTAGALSPAPKPVTQIRRSTPACCMACTTTRVASEKRETGPITLADRNATPSVRMTAETPSRAVATSDALSALPLTFSSLPSSSAIASAERAMARTA